MTTTRPSGRLEVLGLEDREGCACCHERHHCAVGVKSPIEIHLGAAEVEAVACGAAHQRQSSQVVLQVLVTGSSRTDKPSMSRNPKLLRGVRSRFQGLEPLQQVLGEDLRLEWLELLQVTDATARGGKRVGGKLAPEMLWSR